MAEEAVIKASVEQIKQGTSRAFTNSPTVPRPPVSKNAVAPQQANPSNNAAASPANNLASPATPASNASADSATGTNTSTTAVPAGQSANQPAADNISKPQLVNIADLSDEEFEKEMSRRAKRTVSLNDIVAPKVEDTAEQKAEKARRKKEEALAWGLTNKRFKQEDYEKAIALNGKSDRDIAFDAFFADAQEDDKKITREQADLLFSEYYMEAEDDASSLKKLRQKEMSRVANRIRTEANQPIGNFEADYDAEITTEQRFRSYGNQVEDVMGALEKTRNIDVEYEGPEGKKPISIPLNIDEEDIKAVKRNIRARETFLALSSLSKGDVKDTSILESVNYEMNNRLFAKALKQVATEAANKARIETEAYYKGIPRTGASLLNTASPESRPGKASIEKIKEGTRRAFTPSYNRN